jgi:hypothetical protein
VPTLSLAARAGKSSAWLFLAWSLLAGAAAMAIEEPEYEVLTTTGDVEFRRYSPYIVAEVTVSGDAADRRAFQILAGYIFGDNASGEKMSMTAPVETRGAEYAFVMERKYTMETLPKPVDERVQLRHKTPRVVAVRQFSGRWTEKNIGRHRQALLDELAELGIETTGDPELARYNSPFTPWFLRRNEIIVPVDWASVDPGSAIASKTPARL